jgi:CheY-like chemotaxis protein
LFAEDNPTNQFVARQLLKDLDIQMDVVGDGVEAVDGASRFAYDIICMAVQMPEMDGLEATRLIRAQGGQLATIPIIALTANAFPEDIRACFAAGMNQFIARPVNRETLVTAFMRALFEEPAPRADKALVSRETPFRVSTP